MKTNDNTNTNTDTNTNTTTPILLLLLLLPLPLLLILLPGGYRVGAVSAPGKDPGISISISFKISVNT